MVSCRNPIKKPGAPRIPKRKTQGFLIRLLYESLSAAYLYILQLIESRISKILLKCVGFLAVVLS